MIVRLRAAVNFHASDLSPPGFLSFPASPFLRSQRSLPSSTSKNLIKKKRCSRKLLSSPPSLALLLLSSRSFLPVVRTCGGVRGFSTVLSLSTVLTVVFSEFCSRRLRQRHLLELPGISSLEIHVPKQISLPSARSLGFPCCSVHPPRTPSPYMDAYCRFLSTVLIITPFG